MGRKRSMRHLFEALSKVSDGAFIINKDHEVIFWNAAAESILGYTAEQAVGRYCFEILGGRDEQGRTLCQRYCWAIIGLMQGDPQPNIDVYAATADGQGRWINVTTFAYQSGDRGFGSVIVHLFRDVTQHKSNEHFVWQIVEAARALHDLPDGFRHAAPIPRATREPELDGLTPREREVLHLLAHGLSTDEIASTLSISPSTARNHIQNVMGKLGVHSRLEAVAYAYQNDLINEPD